MCGMSKGGERPESFHYKWNWGRHLAEEEASESIKPIWAKQTKNMVPDLPIYIGGGGRDAFVYSFHAF